MNIFKIRFAALSSLHLGYGRRLGIINQTRHYITGKNMWGALASRLARKVMNDYDQSTYNSIGSFVRQDLKFTNFYPVLDEETCLPRYTETGIVYGNGINDERSKYWFESEMIGSYTSTALNMKMAEDGSLHEIEFLKNRAKGHPVNFEGYLLASKESLNDDCEIILNNNKYRIDDVVKTIEVGGERKYGFGRLAFKSIKKDETNKIWDHEFNNGIVKINSGTHTFFNIELNEGLRFIGDIESIVGRMWETLDNLKCGTGQKISDYKLTIVPGSKIMKDIEMKVEDYGIARVV